MISKATKTIIRMLVDDLRRSDSRYRTVLETMDRSELADLQADLQDLTADGPLPEDKTPPPAGPGEFVSDPWQYVSYTQGGNADTSANPKVRRIYVGAGWLYQVELPNGHAGRVGQNYSYAWGPPIFVPNAQLDQHQLDELVNIARQVG